MRLCQWIGECNDLIKICMEQSMDFSFWRVGVFGRQILLGRRVFQEFFEGHF